MADKLGLGKQSGRVILALSLGVILFGVISGFIPQIGQITGRLPRSTT